MEPGRTQDWAEQIAAAQAWWREAGVDLDFADAATDWLAGARAAAAAEAPAAARSDSPRRPVEPVPPPPPARIGGDRGSWPATLEDFGPWWLTEPSLDPAPAARRVLPGGPSGAPLMVVVAMPEREDRERLLSGPDGALLDAILRAFGLARDQCYIASALPAPGAAIDWAGVAAAGMDAILAHHVALAAPHRLIVFGRDVSPLLGHDPAQVSQTSLCFNHDAVNVPLLYAPALSALRERPALKRGLWTRWLDWTGT